MCKERPWQVKVKRWQYSGQPIVMDKDTPHERKTSFVIMRSGDVYDKVGLTQYKVGKVLKDGTLHVEDKYMAKHGARLAQLESKVEKETTDETES